MENLNLKLGESALIINEKGQLCELANYPMRTQKGLTLDVTDKPKVEIPVVGLVGKYGNIHFIK